MSNQQETVRKDEIEHALRAWQGSAHEHGIDLENPVQESRHSGLSRREPNSENRVVEQVDSETLDMTLSDIEQGGKLIAKTIYEMGRPNSSDRFASLMQEAIRIAEEALF